MTEREKSIWCILFSFGMYSLVLLINAVVYSLFGELAAVLLFCFGCICAIAAGIWYAIAYWRGVK